MVILPWLFCPASLVENWMREASRFTPGLKTLKHHGPKRAKESVVLEDVDLVITSYGTLRQDADLMGTMDWCVVIGDEAQHIKNRRSQNARTLTSLRVGVASCSPAPRWKIRSMTYFPFLVLSCPATCRSQRASCRQKIGSGKTSARASGPLLIFCDARKRRGCSGITG